MGIIKNSIDFGSGFNITSEGPIDSRMIVEYISDLTTVWNSNAPAYEGMIVSVLEDGNIYTLRNKDYSDIKNWKKQGSDSVDSGDNGSGIGKYSLPVMTKGMRDDALKDPSSGFTPDSSYISVDVDDSDSDSSLIGETYNNTITSVNGSYLYIMMNTIRALQAEVAKLKNTFQYGIHSYNNEVTAKSSILDQYDDTLMDEPLWALEPDMMSEVFDTPDFKTELIPDNFTISGGGDESIDASVPNQLTFRNGIGKFSDTKKTLLNITDSKLVTYLVTDGKNIHFNLHAKDKKDDTADIKIDIGSFISGDYNKYGVMLVLSRKVGENGKNYIYVSIMNYETNETIVKGYLTEAGNLSFKTGGDSTAYEVGYGYSIESIEFINLTLYRMKFYTKYEDFSENVIPSAPEEDYTYKAAHLTIRSVKNTAMIERIKDQLHENELIWNVDKKELNIKSKNTIYKIGIVGSNDNTNTEETMTLQELIEKLTEMGIIVNAKFDNDGNITKLDDLKLNDISEFTLVNSDTDKKFTFTVDPYGNLVGRDDSSNTIEMNLANIFPGENFDEKLEKMNEYLDVVDGNGNRYGWIRGFIAFYLNSLNKSSGDRNNWSPNADESGGVGDYELLSDRLRISSFYAPLKTDTVHGCSHSFIELENTSDVDIPLEGIYLHFYRPKIENAGYDTDIVYHLALDGVIKSGSTYLIRGAQHAEMDDESTFIKVNSYDKEWYYKKKDDKGNVVDYGLVSFEQEIVITKMEKKEDGTSGAVEDVVNNPVHGAYKFCLTYGLPELDKGKILIEQNNSSTIILQTGQIITNSIEGSINFGSGDFPNIIKNRRYIDGCGFSSFSGFAAPSKYDKGYKRGENEPTCIGKWFCGGVTITENTMFRNMFALDPAKQAYNGWTKTDGSRTRYSNIIDMQVVSLDKEYIGFPNSNEIVPISRYTPKASYENRNVMTDKTQLDREKPNMVTCSFGINVYGTRCFNWISCGAFDEYLWIRSQGGNWKRFESYKKIDNKIEEVDLDQFITIRRKEFDVSVNNAVYARITNRFPGNNVLFTSHKVVIDLTPIKTENVDNPQPVVYEYVVGRADKDGNPDPNHTNEIYTFTLYPDTYEGRTYQITDQQGFHWIEYQVWAATAEKLNEVITTECNNINRNVEEMEEGVKVFPILINTGDMTQSGARINEWLDYYNGGKCLFNHMEQMNCVGNNDLCDVNPNILGTGNDPGKSNAKFFHYFYCYEIPNDDNLIVKAHNATVQDGSKTNDIVISEDIYIPSTYYFETRDVMYVVVNSEITKTACEKIFGLYSNAIIDDKTQSINLYTGIEIRANGNYNNYCQNKFDGSDSDSEPDRIDRVFYPIYETLYSWLYQNTETVDGVRKNKKKVVFACHEIPFTVITQKSLKNNKPTDMGYTRNYPNGFESLLGSKMNQLDFNENRGVYWFSRLLENFGCKLCIGGHKHTYALSYPIKENYKWKRNLDSSYVSSCIESEDDKEFISNPKIMKETLEDEAGLEPEYKLLWEIETKNDNGNDPYNVKSTNSITISSTKTPYIPLDLYSMIGEKKFTGNNDYYRCCTPINTHIENDGKTRKYDGFVNYSMCQATGYKLKSNKELPSAYQVFSKIIPETTYPEGKDKPSGNQLYPMYSVLEINHDNNNVCGINVKMCRVAGIFEEDNSDVFSQTKYGNRDLKIHYLVGVNDSNVDIIKSALNIDDISETNYMYGVWVPENTTYEDNNGIIVDLVSMNEYLNIKY